MSLEVIAAYWSHLAHSLSLSLRCQRSLVVTLAPRLPLALSVLVERVRVLVEIVRVLGVSGLAYRACCARLPDPLGQISIELDSDSSTWITEFVPLCGLTVPLWCTQKD